MRSSRFARERLGLELAAIVINRAERPLEYDLGRNTDRTRSIFALRLDRHHEPASVVLA